MVLVFMIVKIIYKRVLLYTKSGLKKYKPVITYFKYLLKIKNLF